MNEARPVEKDATLQIIARLLQDFREEGDDTVTIEAANYEYGGVSVEVLTRSGDLATVRIKAER